MAKLLDNKHWLYGGGMVEIFVCGDILNHTSKNTEIFDCALSNIIKGADYSICNFEAPIKLNANPIQKAGPVKSQSKEIIPELQKSGFNLFLLANNHIFDYGKKGLEATINEAKKYGIVPIGAGLSLADAYRPSIHTIGGLTFGFVNAAEAQFGVLKEGDSNSGYAWINSPRINEIIIKLREEVDFLIFFAHAGLEHYDIPLIEWKERYKEFCDLGVDIVIGSHPHVVQGYENYNGSIIFYSLGNFYFPKSLSDIMYGYSVSLKFDIGKAPSFDLIYHKLNNGELCLVESEITNIDISDLNNKIIESEYRKIIPDVYKSAFNKICFPYFASVHNAILPSDGVRQKIIKIIKQLIPKSNNSNNKLLLLMHLINNETYYYITLRYLTEHWYNQEL